MEMLEKIKELELEIKMLKKENNKLKEEIDWNSLLLGDFLDELRPEITDVMNSIVEEMGGKIIIYVKYVNDTLGIQTEYSSITNYDLEIHLNNKKIKSINIYRVLDGSSIHKLDMDRRKNIINLCNALAQYIKEEIILMYNETLDELKEIGIVGLPFTIDIDIKEKNDLTKIGKLIYFNKM